MKNKFVSYRTCSLLSLIPFIGFLIAWLLSWLTIYKVTKDRKYIFLHYLIWILPMIISGGLFAVCYFSLFAKIANQQLLILCTLIGAYLVCVIIAYSAIFIAKKIIDNYNKKMLSE